MVAVKEFGCFSPPWSLLCTNTDGVKAPQMTRRSEGRRQPSCEWCGGWAGWILLLWPKGNQQLWTTCAKVRRERKEGGSKGKEMGGGAGSCLLRSCLLCHFLGCWPDIDYWFSVFYFNFWQFVLTLYRPTCLSTLTPRYCSESKTKQQTDMTDIGLQNQQCCFSVVLLGDWKMKW